MLILIQVNTHLWYFDNVIRWQSVRQRLLGEVSHCFLLLFGAQANLLECSFRNLAAVLLNAIETFEIALQVRWVYACLNKFAWRSKLIEVQLVDRAVHT